MKARAIATLTGAAIASAALLSARQGDAAAAVDWSAAQRIEVTMSEYEFIPNILRLRHAVPYRLHLVNAGKEGHEFTAQDFFAAAEVRDRAALNNGKSIYLRPGEIADIYVVVPTTGLFAPRCADHDWAGMTATIVVD
jgi:uncharacterized cupredoxin-like copper-binding protein